MAEEIIETNRRSVTTIVDTSTIGVAAAKNVHDRLANSELAYIDAPVSGGIAGAAAATIALMFAGSKEHFVGLSYVLKTMSKNLSLEAWNKLGFKSKNLKELDYFNNLEARLVAPDGLDGRFFLVFKNYKSILYYNCSHYYALTVGLLSDKIK